MSASRLVIFFLLALSIGPVFAVDVPAMRDSPNHLAVASVLSRSGTDAANPFYQVAWTFNTNFTGGDEAAGPLPTRPRKRGRGIIKNSIRIY
jgi:hypothetical protein